MVKRNKFSWKKERNVNENISFCTKSKFILEREKEFMGFLN